MADSPAAAPARNPFSLAGKVALVTGASRGIGRSVAQHLAGAGSDVILVGRDAAALADTAALCEAAGNRVLTLKADVTDLAAMRGVVSSAQKSFEKIDTLVCNAGIQNLKPFLEMTPSDWQTLIATNLEGAINTLHAAGAAMTAQKSGSVMVMSSIYGFVGAPGNSIYCLTKAGLMQLARALAIEWARYSVRVNSICPGWISTELTAPYMQDQRVIDAALKQIPLRRFGQPDDIGPLAVYLASDAASYITGQAFVVDGGQIAR